jgi:hypothetical protein
MMQIINKKSGRQRKLRRPRPGSEDNIWHGITEIGCESIDLNHFSGLCKHRNKSSGSMRVEVC